MNKLTSLALLCRRLHWCQGYKCQVLNTKSENGSYLVNLTEIRSLYSNHNKAQYRLRACEVNL